MPNIQYMYYGKYYKNNVATYLYVILLLKSRWEAFWLLRYSFGTDEYENLAPICIIMIQLFIYIQYIYLGK